MTTTTQTPNLNHAAAALIEALHDMDALRGFREGLRPTLQFTEQVAAASPSHTQEAQQALAVWRALDALAAAVLDRKENAR